MEGSYLTVTERTRVLNHIGDTAAFILNRVNQDGEPAEEITDLIKILNEGQKRCHQLSMALDRILVYNDRTELERLTDKTACKTYEATIKHSGL